MKPHFILFLLFTASVAVYPQISYPIKFYQQDSTINIKESCLLEISNGDLLLFWFHYYHKSIFSYEGKIFYSRSTDKGLTWSDNSLLVEYVFYDPVYYGNEIDVITDNSGRIYAVYKNANHYLKYSDDNGFSWVSRELPLYLIYGLLENRKVSEAKLNLLNNGKLALTYNYLSKGINAIYSDDGLNWTARQIIDTEGKGGSIITLSENKYMLIYSDSVSNYWNLVFRMSTDTGNTWSDKQILLSSSFNDFNPRSVKDSNDKIWIYFERKDVTPFPEFTQSEIYFITSTDNGLNWSQPEKFTSYAGMDFNHSVTLMNDIPLLSFISTRSYQIDKNYSQIFYGNQPDVNTPPYIHYSYHEPLEPQLNEPVTIRAYADDDKRVDSVKIIIKRNVHQVDTLMMYDDGLNNDLLAGDNIYGIVLNYLAGDAIQYDFLVYDDELNIAGINGSYFFIPLSYFTDRYRFEINRFKLPIDNSGIIAYLEIDTISNGKFDEGIILHSAGFYLSGKNGNDLWANGIFPSQRLRDYHPGIVGSFPSDPKNQLYIVRASDPHFGESWQNYKYAVMLGADFYDGDGNGIYNPTDLNGNGIWDLNEDRPDILGDVTTWCVYNDNVPREYRKFYQIDPLGIEIHQTTFAWGDNLIGDIKNIIFFRYRIYNRGTVSALLDSVYFGVITDPDIGGEYFDELAGVDTLLNTSFCYNARSDSVFGINPPAFSTVLLQGPEVSLPDETFLDLNGNNIFDEGIDTPLDTAYNNNGLFIGSNITPGAKNLNATSLVHFCCGEVLSGDPNTYLELRNYMLGKNRLGDYIDPCTWYNSEVRGGIDCSQVNPVYWYSGDPVNDIGWINTVPTDQRILLNTGPFNLEVNKPVDIIVAYLGARGTSSLNSVTEAKKVAEYANNFYKTNFTQLPSDIENERIIPATFALYQNYPNPFNPSTIIRYQIPEAGLVTLKVFDILGREVETLVNEFKKADVYEVNFNASKYASGVYFYQIKAGNYLNTKKMIVIK